MDEKDYLITDEELKQNGVCSAADYVSGDPADVKNIFDKLPKLIADKLNGFISAVIKKFADYYNKDEIDSKEKTLNEAIGAKANSKDVYDKNSTYTKDETNQQIEQKLVSIGAGDMAKSVYDTNGDGVVDNAENAKNAKNSENVGGFWFAFEDAEGNATEELHVHYYVDEDGNVVTTPIT